MDGGRRGKVRRNTDNTQERGTAADTRQHSSRPSVRGHNGVRVPAGLPAYGSRHKVHSSHPACTAVSCRFFAAAWLSGSSKAAEVQNLTGGRHLCTSIPGFAESRAPKKHQVPHLHVDDAVHHGADAPVWLHLGSVWLLRLKRVLTKQHDVQHHPAGPGGRQTAHPTQPAGSR